MLRAIMKEIGAKPFNVQCCVRNLLFRNKLNPRMIQRVRRNGASVKRALKGWSNIMRTQR
jgi:hypothetical protein